MNDPRIPPQNIAFEEQILGCMLANENNVRLIGSLINETHFYKNSHRLIYLAITDLYNHGKPTDIVSVVDELTKRKEIEQCGGSYYLTELFGKASPSVDEIKIKHWTEGIIDKSIKRKTLYATSKIKDDCYDDSASAEDMIVNASHEINTIGKELHGDVQTVHISSVIHNIVENLPNLFKSYHKTFYPSLDRYLDIGPTDFIIIAARPSVGKTAFALNLARNNVINKIPVGFFSIEMSKQKIGLRLLYNEAKIDKETLKHAIETEDQNIYPQIAYACGNIYQRPLFLDDTSALNIQQLRAKVANMVDKYGIKQVYVDFLQLMSMPKAETRNLAIDVLSNAIKSMTKEFEIPFIVLSQLSRATEKRTDAVPILSDLRDSGSLEQAADTVIFLHPSSENAEFLDVIIAKQRDGPKHTIQLKYLRQFSSFEDHTENFFLNPLEEE